jgi:nucleoside-diphosphate-sugar epimerase
MNQDRSTKPERVVVAGGAGFIGSEVTRQLLEHGHQLRVIDNLSSAGSRKPDGAEFEVADLSDLEATSRLFAGFDSCVLLAGRVGGIGYFHTHPATILSENLRLLASVFEAAAEHRMRRIVYVSSSVIFEMANEFPSTEASVAGLPAPVTGYGFAKLAGERFCEAFLEERGLHYSICRPFNAYGPNELPGEEIGYAHVIPDLVLRILAGERPLRLLGSGNQTRCFTHISDIARGIVMSLESPAAEDQGFNIASPEETSIAELARMIFEICHPGEEFAYTGAKPFQLDVMRRWPDTTKARQVLGFESRVDLETGLREYVDWLRALDVKEAKVGGGSRPRL